MRLETARRIPGVAVVLWHRHGRRSVGRRIGNGVLRLCGLRRILRPILRPILLSVLRPIVWRVLRPVVRRSLWSSLWSGLRRGLRIGLRIRLRPMTAMTTDVQRHIVQVHPRTRRAAVGVDVEIDVETLPDELGQVNRIRLPGAFAAAHALQDLERAAVRREQDDFLPGAAVARVGIHTLLGSVHVPPAQLSGRGIGGDGDELAHGRVADRRPLVGIGRVAQLDGAQAVAHLRAHVFAGERALPKHPALVALHVAVDDDVGAARLIVDTASTMA